MTSDDATIRSAAEATVDAGTASFEMRLESEPAGVGCLRSEGVCDFAHQRSAVRTVTEQPAGVPDFFQIIDGGIVYSRASGEEWDALDMGSWSAASLMSVLGWLYGAVDVQVGDSGELQVTMSARRAVEACPAPLRDGLRAAFDQAGHRDGVATGWVRTDGANRVTECRLVLPGSENGLYGTFDVRARITLTLSGFGEPAHIRPPDAGPAQPIAEYAADQLRCDLDGR